MEVEYISSFLGYKEYNERARCAASTVRTGPGRSCHTLDC